MPWELTGNAGTAPANNFLGTTDNQPLAVRTNGQERMTITPDGNVGIGTGAMPVTAKLHIEGAFEPLRVGDNNYYFFAGANRGGGDYVDIGAFHSIQGWKSLVLNRGAGNVGIGTATPGYRLTVNGVVQSLSGGFRFPDGSVQTTATLRGPAGPQGPPGPPGPAVSTSAVCVDGVGVPSGSRSCFCSGTTVSRVSSPCNVTSNTGPCPARSAFWQGIEQTGQCCVCAPA
jgi:hypothetical protein